jgi:phenylpropionate dioxygenase-like ring-hydroxylating dioxygenase large terminal subunit
MRVAERLGYLWLADRETPLSTLPRWDFEADFRFCGAFGTRFRAPLHVVLDNFSEDEHTPFVHTRLGWNEADADRIGFRADNHGNHTSVHYDAPQRPTRVGRLFGLRPGDVFHNDWVTRFEPVCTVYETKWVEPRTGEPRPLRITSPMFFVPIDEHTTMLHAFVFVRLGALHDRLFPLLKHIATAAAWAEVRDDARFIPVVAKTPSSMTGMRLGKFDKPLIHNRRLLESLYFGKVATGRGEPVSLLDRR